jgi:plasmid replication initiation protein
MSVAAKRIMARVIDQIRDDDFKLRPYYQFRIIDIIAEAGITRETAYKEVQGALRELSAAAWEFESLDGSEWYIRHLLDTTKERAIGYKDGIITVLLNPQLEPYFVQIAHYSTYQLNNYMGLKSWYSMRFFEILSAFRDTGVWCPTIEQYRQLMDCSEEKDKRGKVKRDKNGSTKMKYPDTRDLIRFTMTEPIEELASTNLAFNYEPVYETARMTRGRKKITGFKFTLTRKQDGKIPSYWLQNVVVSKVVASLREWKVTDKNISLYLEDIGTKTANKLLYEWQLKENTDDRIKDRTKYCNAVFVRAGQASQEKIRREVQVALNIEKQELL